MSLRRSYGLVLGIAVFAAGSLPLAAAKPPDLPVNYQDTFTPGAAPSAASATTVGAAARLPAPAVEEQARLLLARRLYRLGQQCLQKGEREMACNCFHEVHLLAPTSRYGLHALQLLQTWGNSPRPDTGAAEVQEPPAPAEAPPAAGSESDSPPGASKTSSLSPQRRLARQLYRLGERYRQRGDCALALVCYQEVQHLCPDSRYARRATRRLRELQNMPPASPANLPD